MKNEQNGEETMATLENLDALECPICYEPLCAPVYQVPPVLQVVYRNLVV